MKTVRMVRGVLCRKRRGVLPLLDTIETKRHFGSERKGDLIIFE